MSHEPISFVLSHQWVSVEERLPESDVEDVLTFTGCNMYGVEEYAVAHYDGKDWHTSAGEHFRPEYWMAIPQLNNKKEDK